MHVINHPDQLKKPTTLALIETALADQNARQDSGFLHKKDISSQAKNAKVLKLLEVHSRVKEN